MRKIEQVTTVKEDIVMGKHKKAKIDFLEGYDDFQFPLTVSFEEHGVYMIRIEGKTATCEKLS